MLSLCCLVV